MIPTLSTTIFDGDVHDDAIASWLAQFDTEDHHVITRLLSHFLYYSPRRLTSRLRELHAGVLNALGTASERLWFVPVGYVAKSGAAIAYFYRNANNVPLGRFVSASDLPRVRLTSDDAVVVLDDYIGSGHQAVQVWSKLVGPALSRTPNARSVFAVVVAQDIGREHVRKQTGFSVVASHILTAADRPLSPESRIFPTEAERANARRVLEKYATRLDAKYPLGYASTEGLISFFYSTPNNTLPIFWAATDSWKPLLPHGESFRDPDSLIGPPVGVGPGVASLEPERPIVETAELEGYDIPTEVVTSLLAEFKVLPVVLVFAPIVKSLGISDSALTSLLTLVAQLKYLEHEREPARTALVVIPDRGELDSATLVFEGVPGHTVSNIAEVLSLVQTIDGFSGAVVIKSSGAVVGNVMFPESDDRVDPYISRRYWAPAAASIQFDGPVFVFAGRGRASVFYRGKRVTVHRGASWHYQPSQLDKGLSALAARHQIEAEVLKDVLPAAYELSDAGEGGLIAIGDSDAVLRMSKPLKATGLRWRPKLIRSIKREALLGLISRDGATVIASDGLVLQGMTTLRPPAGAGEAEEGTGTRHATAAEMSTATRAVCVTVSVTGPISVFVDGKVAFKMMG